MAREFSRGSNRQPQLDAQKNERGQEKGNRKKTCCGSCQIIKLTLFLPRVLIRGNIPSIIPLSLSCFSLHL